MDVVEKTILAFLSTEDSIKKLRHQVLWNEINYRINVILANPKYKELGINNLEGGVLSEPQSPLT